MRKQQKVDRDDRIGQYQHQRKSQKGTDKGNAIEVLLFQRQRLLFCPTRHGKKRYVRRALLLLDCLLVMYETCIFVCACWLACVHVSLFCVLFCKWEVFAWLWVTMTTNLCTAYVRTKAKADGRKTNRKKEMQKITKLRWGEWQHRRSEQGVPIERFGAHWLTDWLSFFSLSSLKWRVYEMKTKTARSM